MFWIQFKLILCPDLGQNSLQRLSADKKVVTKRVKHGETNLFIYGTYNMTKKFHLPDENCTQSLIHCKHKILTCKTVLP